VTDGGWKRDQDTWTPLKQAVLSERIYSSETRLCKVDLSRVASVQKFENQQSSRERPEESHTSLPAGARSSSLTRDCERGGLLS